MRAVPLELWTIVQTELVKEALADKCLEHWERHGFRGCECWDDYEYGKPVPPCAGSFDYKRYVESCSQAVEDFVGRGGLDDLIDSSSKVRAPLPCSPARSLRLSLT